MNFAIWILIGTVLGVLIDRFGKVKLKGGLASSIAIGILGSLEGGFLYNFVLNNSLLQFDTISITFAIVGSATLLVTRRIFSLSQAKQNA